MDFNKLNNKQLRKVGSIMRATTELRKRITLYKRGDGKLALFRVTAFNMVQDAVILKVLNRPWTKAITSWLDWWNDGSDLGKDIQALFQAIKEYKRR